MAVPGGEAEGATSAKFLAPGRVLIRMGSILGKNGIFASTTKTIDQISQGFKIRIFWGKSEEFWQLGYLKTAILWITT